MGFNIEYQKPFYGEPLGNSYFSKKEIQFEKRYEYDTIYFNSPNNSLFEIEKMKNPNYFDITFGRMPEDSKWSYYISIYNRFYNDAKDDIKSIAKIKYPDNSSDIVSIVHIGVGEQINFIENHNNYSPKGGQYSVKFYANINYSQLSAKSNTDWCHSVSIYNGFVYFTLDKNTLQSNRNTSITLTSESGKKSHYYFTQPYYYAEFKDFHFMSIDRNMHTLSNTLITNMAKFEFKDTCDVDWIDYSWNGNELTVNVEKYLTKENKYREGVIKIEHPNGEPLYYIIRQSPYSIGDLYKNNGVKGVVFEIKGEEGKILSLKEKRSKWSLESVRTGATDLNDGLKNIKAIKTIKNYKKLYPAFAFCEKLNKKESEEWYLPSINELGMIMYHSEKINKSLKRNKLSPPPITAFKGLFTSNKKTRVLTHFWSSTETNKKEVDCYYFYATFYRVGDSYIYTEDNYAKNTKGKVRAIRKITLEKQ